MEHRTITIEEIQRLARYEGINQSYDPHRYDIFDKETLASFCRMKDRSNDLYIKRYQTARDVIDILAMKVGIDPQNTSFWLYSPEPNGTSPIADKMDDFFSRNGEKAKLKKRIDELERENSLLRSLLQK